MDFENFKKKYQKVEPKEYIHKVTPQPTLSVLVQTYQHERYIKDCLNGILQQETTFSYEIILGEDNSSDRTREICIEFAEKYPEKIRLFFHHPENKIKVLNNTTGNFNALYNFYSANGEFIAFCEGDDVWKDPSKLQKQVNFLKSREDYVLSFHSFTEIDSGNNLISAEHTLEQPKADISSEDLSSLKYNPLLSTVCVRNKIIIPQEIIEVINIDSFLISILGSIGKGKYQKEIKNSLYRRHSAGIWGTRRNKEKWIVKLHTYSKLYKYHQIRNHKVEAEIFRSKLLNTYKMIMYQNIKQLKPLSFGTFLFKYLRHKL